MQVKHPLVTKAHTRIQVQEDYHTEFRKKQDEALDKVQQSKGAIAYHKALFQFLQGETTRMKDLENQRKIDVEDLTAFVGTVTMVQNKMQDLLKNVEGEAISNSAIAAEYGKLADGCRKAQSVVQQRVEDLLKQLEEGTDPEDLGRPDAKGAVADLKQRKAEAKARKEAKKKTTKKATKKAVKDANTG